MSLLLDALKNASAQKDKNTETLSQSAQAAQDLDSSQQRATSLFNSSRKSPSRIPAPAIISSLALVIIAAGIYWWPFHNDMQNTRLATSIATTPVKPVPSPTKENSGQATKVAPETQAMPTGTASPNIDSETEQLERMTAIVDQMQQEHAYVLLNHERKRKELEKALSEKSNALTVAHNQAVSLNMQIKKMTATTEKVNAELRRNKAEQKLAQQQYNQEKSVSSKRLAELESSTAKINREYKLAAVKNEKLAQENTGLKTQVQALEKEHDDSKTKQALASANIEKIQQVQNGLFQQLKAEYQQALQKIENYERKAQSSKSIASSKQPVNPEDGISLRLETQLKSNNF
jgi:hypothetical protein